MTYRINIPLSPQEFEALRSVSQLQLRHPRDHARFILRSVLLGEQSQECNKSVTASNLAERTVNGLVTGNPS